MSKIDFQALAASLNPETILPQWLPDGQRRGGEWVARNPTRNDKTLGSFSINLRTGAWGDFSTGDEGGDLISLWAYLHHNNDNVAAARDLMERQGIAPDSPTPSPAAAGNVKRLEQPRAIIPVPADVPAPTFNHFEHGEPSRVWTYYTADGQVLLYVCRFDHADGSKDIIPRSWCEHPGKPARWTWRGITGKALRPIYGLDRLAALPDAEVLVVEGEKAADAAQDMLGKEVAVVSWLGGSGTVDKLDLTPLRGRSVTLWPDFDSKVYPEKHQRAGEIMDLHDQPGAKNMITIAQGLAGVASSVMMVGGYEPGDGKFADGWDLADAQAQGWKSTNIFQFMELHAADWRAVAAGKGSIKTREVADNVEPQDVHAMQEPGPWSFPHTSSKGRLQNTIPNLKHLLNHYGIHVGYDVIRKSIKINIPGQAGTADNRATTALSVILSLCSRAGLPKAETPEFLLTIADENPVNPVLRWIESAPWDGKDRFGDLAKTLQTRPGYDRDLLRLILRRWMVSAVAAAAMPEGFRGRGVLVLQGPQSIGKTAWFMSLVPNEMRDLLKVDAVLDPNNKDTIISAMSHWLVELGELDATFRKADIARLKGILTADYDMFRRPYARSEERYPRRTVFFASVNDAEFLVDDTGNSRWWTVPVIDVDFHHSIDMQQVWAQALALFRQGERWWLDRDEEARLEAANDRHRKVDPIEELILSKYDVSARATRRLSATEILIEVGFDRPTNAQAQKAAAVLRRTFGEPRKSTKGRRLYDVPELLNEINARHSENVGHAYEHERPF
ncbi:VapE family protein [Celeribacter halophilus]|uniref:VapE family protein n=1 Tax=Celeribacter halophilus TaxID=576117 RepID=A0AAW7XVG9_9RHOB|nr:VapE domain-containing protein [Celeribacter halophilus]MDO6458045.1 VapE family protein [Celeribacter halophilus]